MKRTHLNQVVHHPALSNQRHSLEEDCNDEEREEKARRARQVQQGLGQHESSGCRRAFQVLASGEKHHHHQKRKEKENHQKLKKKKNGVGQYEGQYEGQYDLSGLQTQQDGRPQPSVSKLKNGESSGGYDSRLHDVMTTMSREACAAAQSQHSKGKKDYKRVSLHQSIQNTVQYANKQE